MPKTPSKNKINIDLDLIQGFGRIWATHEEIANVIGMTREGLRKRMLKEPEIHDALEKGRSTGRISLRRKQFDVAMNGNPTMLIWLGKQLLGQTDTVVSEVNVSNNVEEMSNAQLADLLKKNGRELVDPLEDKEPGSV